MLLIFVK